MIPRKWRQPAREIALAAAILLACALCGSLFGWQGRPKTAISTRVWPFYLDTWFTQAVFSWRILLSLVAGAAAWLTARRFLAKPDWLSLSLLVIGAYAFEFACGIQRFGLTDGLQHTLHRGQEYWWDVRYVVPGFLARFPEVGRLSQHGATHPPGLILILAGLSKLGISTIPAAAIACSLTTPLSALVLYAAARRLIGEAAPFAVVIFLFACSVTAFTITAMEMWIVLLAVISLYGFARAKDGSLGGGIIWGLAFAYAGLCSFTSLTLAFSFAALLWHERHNLDRFRMTSLALGPIAFIAFYAVLISIGYRPVHVFEQIWMAFNQSDDAQRSRALALLGNPVAFLGSLGLPLLGLSLLAIADAVRSTHPQRNHRWLLVAALLPPLVCTLMGKPRAEVERIYLPFFPMLAIALGYAAKNWYQRGAWLTHLAVPVLIAQSIAIEIFFDTLW